MQRQEATESGLSIWLMQRFR